MAEDPDELETEFQRILNGFTINIKIIFLEISFMTLGVKVPHSNPSDSQTPVTKGLI